MKVKFINQETIEDKGILGYYKEIEINENLFKLLCKKKEMDNYIFLNVGGIKIEFKINNFGFEELSEREIQKSGQQEKIILFFLFRKQGMSIVFYFKKMKKMIGKKKIMMQLINCLTCLSMIAILGNPFIKNNSFIPPLTGDGFFYFIKYVSSTYLVCTWHLPGTCLVFIQLKICKANFSHYLFLIS